MDMSHAAYRHKKRQSPEVIVLLTAMTMTLAVPIVNNHSTIAKFGTRQTSGQFDSNRSDNIINAMKLVAIEKRKRKLKQRIPNGLVAGFSDEIFLLPYKTADLLAELNIEPDYISSTEDKGILFEFHFKNNYHSIEFFPDGEVILLQELEGLTKTYGPKTWGEHYQNYISQLHTIIA